MPEQRAFPKPRTRCSAAQSTSTFESEIQLAIDATKNLYNLGAQLKLEIKLDKRRLKRESEHELFYTLFTGELLMIPTSLEAAKANCDHAFRTKLQERMKKLLRVLECVCSGNQRDQLAAGYSQRQNYPSLITLKKTSYTIKPNLYRFATSDMPESKKRQNQVLKILRSFVRYIQESQGNTGILDPGVDSELANKISEEPAICINSLYDIINTHRCRAEPGKALPITTNLGLNASKVTDDDQDDVSVFRLFFLGHPHQKDRHTLSGKWQETQMHVKPPGKVEFFVEKAEAFRPVIENELCEYVTKGENALLPFLVSDDTLMIKSPKLPTKSWLWGLPSVPLTELLTTSIFAVSKKMRLRLSHLVARAVWQYYDSNWMSKEWTKDDIQFMFENDQTDSKPCLFVDDPFLHANIDAGANEIPKDNVITMFTRLHGYPKILALGILLIEIELGTRIELHRQPQFLDDNMNPNINTDYATAVDLLDNQPQKWARQETFPKHKEIIRACLDQKIFNPNPENTVSERDILLKSVVLPLEMLFQKVWYGPAADVLPISSTYFPSYIPPGSHYHDMAPRVSEVRTDTLRTHSLCIRNTIPDSECVDDSQNWLLRVGGCFYNVLRARKSFSKHDRVRIAVLDTGIDPDHYSYANVHGYKDFVDTNASWSDTAGHGSIGVHLIVKLFPTAEVYVARVFRHTEAESNTPELMAQAIRHARKTWKVDILTIASGFSDDYWDIHEEILKAKAKGILVFAAASNYANTEQITFPARMHGEVMCMFASNGKAKNTRRDTNPAPSRRANYNFALLGEDVDVCFAPGSSRRENGTSISTFIGAAVAGILLDFSRQEDCKHRIHSPHILKTVPGMSAVFAKMADGGQDKGYDCVAPWKLVEYPDGQQYEREDQREYICGTISRILDKVRQGQV